MKRSPNLATSGLFARLDLAKQQRLRDISEYWDFYLGDQWDVTREEGETLLTFNYAKAIVDKSVSFLFGRGFRLQIAKDLDDTIRQWLEEVWQYNDKEVKAIEMGQMGSVSGDCFLKVSWEEPELDAEGKPYDDLYPDGRVRIDVLPTALVDPVFHPHDRNRMVSCTIQYAVVEEDPLTRETKTYVYREVITRDKITIYHDDEEQESFDNPLREINVVQVRNMPLAGSSFGQSDLASIVPLQREYNAKCTDVSDIINYHAAPITIIQGAKTKNLERGAKKVWGGLPKDAKVYNLELGSDLNASNAFIDKLKTALHELSNTPEDSLGAKAAISNTSGVALQIKYAPLLEKTWTKRLTYGRGITDVCRLILKLLRLKGTDEQRETLSALMEDPATTKALFSTTVVFPDPLPKDELVQMQILAQKMNMGIEEPEGALREIGYEDNVKEKIQKVLAWRKSEQDIAFDLAAKELPDIGAIETQMDANLKGDE